MSNQRVNDMSNRNYNNYSIAKKTIAVVGKFSIEVQKFEGFQAL